MPVEECLAVADCFSFPNPNSRVVTDRVVVLVFERIQNLSFQVLWLLPHTELDGGVAFLAAEMESRELGFGDYLGFLCDPWCSVSNVERWFVLQKENLWEEVRDEKGTMVNNVNAVFYATTYHPIQAGSIDGTDITAHDNGVYRALLASATGLCESSPSLSVT